MVSARNVPTADAKDKKKNEIKTRRKGNYPSRPCQKGEPRKRPSRFTGQKTKGRKEGNCVVAAWG